MDGPDPSPGRADDPAASSRAVSSELSRAVISRCLDLGFAAAGVCSLEPSQWSDEFRGWLGAGKHGTMGWLENNADVRVNPGRLVEGARSAVMVADLYATRASNVDGALGAGEGRVARYGRGRDYHEVLKKRVHGLCDELRAQYPGATFRAFVDTAPVFERELAQRSGLGWTGKHTLTIHPRAGSYLLLGGFMTSLELTPPPEQTPVDDHCGTCTRCIDACPTDAITPYSVDASRCVSYLTIEHRAPIDPGFFEGIGEWMFGCDICQEVCPHNSVREPGALPGYGREPNPAYASGRDRFDLLEVLGWSPEDRSRTLSKSAMKRATLAMWKRNALIVLGNQHRARADDRVREQIERVAHDAAEDPLVRNTARAVLASLDAGSDSGSD